MTKPSWDIFCQVIDNYGDIGVCWRLARQLANEQSIAVRLWVDEIDALILINPQVQNIDRQIVEQVEVCIWQQEFAPTSVADVVIEAFACELPASYLVEMAKIGHSITADSGQVRADGQNRSAPPLWINLEYLSAEPWVEDCHQVNSFHAPTGLNKTFYFPGFSDKTGGLLREAQLLKTRDRFNASPSEQSQFLSKLGFMQRPPGTLVSLFSYENNAISGLIKVWQNSPTPIHCLVPIGKSLASINQALEQTLKSGQSLNLGNLTLTVIPFLSQTDYDRLLWLCDVNFVRGEDSFVRAQWAVKPMIWHIYPQDDAAHMAKLQAFLAVYQKGSKSELGESLNACWLGWNHAEDISAHWQRLMDLYPDWQQFCQHWCGELSLKTGLADNLVKFSSKNNSQHP